MVLIVVAALLILAIAFYQVAQGLFSALVMAILTVLSAAAAFAFYEPLAELLYSRQPTCADAISLIATFVLPLLVLRIVLDRFVGGNVVLGVWPDRVFGGALGLITGTIMVGVLTIAVQMLPFGTSVMTYKPFDDSLQRQQSLAPFYCDQATVGLMKVLSAGSLSGSRRFAAVHDDLLLETFCARNTAGKFGRVDALPDALGKIEVFNAPDSQLAPWRNDVPANPLMAKNQPYKDVIVRCRIDKSARDESGAGDGEQRWRLPATHFRLVTENGQSHYPVAYLTFEAGVWQAHYVVKEGKTQVAQLVVVRPAKKEMDSLIVDWVYRIPNDEKPQYVVFRRTAKQAAGKAYSKVMPPSQQALDREGLYEGKDPKP